MTSIVILGLVAAFLGLRLYSVLGKRTGHEQTYGQPEETTVPPIAGGSPAEEKQERAPHNENAEPVAEASAEPNLRAIAGLDRNFIPADFVGGAKQAYELILEAYWKGDLSEVKPFMADDVHDAFAEAIEARAAAGEVLDNRLIRIERAVISAAQLEKGNGHITVRFDADIAAVTRNKDGQVIAGSLIDAVPTHDAWTFSRDLKGRDPNWILTDTDEAS